MGLARIGLKSGKNVGFIILLMGDISHVISPIPVLLPPNGTYSLMAIQERRGVNYQLPCRKKTMAPEKAWFKRQLIVGTGC